MCCISSLLLFGLLWAAALGAECIYKECFCEEDDIICEDGFLKSIPPKLSNKGLFRPRLLLDRNQITIIPDGSLPSNLSEISAQNNPIETIGDAALDESINTLQTLTFSEARFTQIPKAVVQLNDLESLSISDTNILVWRENDMKRVGSTMRTLNLDTVGLTTWPTWLQTFSHLRILRISGSSISFLPDEALDMAANLYALDLSNNSLTSVPEALLNLTTLNTLSLEHNRIVDITCLPQLSKLSTLKLNNNAISNAGKLRDVLRIYADTLTTFEIHDNFLTVIPDLPFLSKITSLDYTNNHILDPHSGSISPILSELKLENNFLFSVPGILKNITAEYIILFLSHNRFRSIQGAEIPSSTSGVQLGQNLITELTDTSFPQNSKIVYLYLNNNPLTKVSSLAFQNLPNLRELNLRFTHLTRLPLAIASLKSLSLIDVTGCIYLVCTCAEKSLESRIKAIEPEDAVGDCGLTSLYTFFTMFSPNCPTPRDIFLALKRN